MRLLLYTHVAIWALSESNKLPTRIGDIITDPVNVVFVSVASLWEIAIKRALGKGNVPPFSGRDAIQQFNRIGFDLLPITAEHAAAVEVLPRLHGDTFDRLLVAQALTEPLRLVTHDPRVAAYGETTIHW